MAVQKPTKLVKLDSRGKALPYGGYYRTEKPEPAQDLTNTDPGTPLGEYMRRFWQPVAMAEQLKDVPIKIRIMGEDLIAFRDGEGKIGVLHRACCHRGTSLEYGIVQERGIRCCYHGINFDIDGTIIDAPLEADRGKSASVKLTQGAYPAFERDGLVFAYLGPPDQKPPFPEWDAFQKSGDLELRPFTNVFPCNWLQVLDNIADQMHTYALHNPPFLYNGNLPDLNWQGLTLASCQSVVPVMDYVESRNGTAMTFAAGRRVDKDTVWFRIQDLILPNMSQHAYLFEDGSERRIFHRVGMSRWYVPVDNQSSIIFGWRMFGSEADPFGKGRRERVGWDDMDFLEGQTGNRPHDESVKLPGDWEAIVAQGKIAIHSLENPLTSDVGVYLFRRLLRQAISDRNPYAAPAAMHSQANLGNQNYCYTQNDVLRIAELRDPQEDRENIRRIGREIISVTAEADGMPPEARNSFVRQKIEALERASANAMTA